MFFIKKTKKEGRKKERKMEEMKIVEETSIRQTIQEMRLTILHKKGKSRYVVRILSIENGDSHHFPFITEMQNIVNGKESLRISWGVDNLEKAQERLESAVMRLCKRQKLKTPRPK